MGEIIATYFFFVKDITDVKIAGVKSNQREDNKLTRNNNQISNLSYTALNK